MRKTSVVWNLLACLVPALLLASCTNQQVYEQLQSNERQRCDRLVAENARAECLAGLGTDYQRYRQERDELSSSKNTNPNRFD